MMQWKAEMLTHTVAVKSGQQAIKTGVRVSRNIVSQGETLTCRRPCAECHYMTPKVLALQDLSVHNYSS